MTDVIDPKTISKITISKYLAKVFIVKFESFDPRTVKNGDIEYVSNDSTRKPPKKDLKHGLLDRVKTTPKSPLVYERLTTYFTFDFFLIKQI